MAIKTTRALIVLGAFVAGLVLCFGVVMLVAGPSGSPIRPHRIIRRLSELLP